MGFNFKNISLNTILLLGIVVLLFLFLQQCNRSSKLKDELFIDGQNLRALNDTISTYKTKNGEVVYDKSILIADKKQLKELNKDLYDEINNLNNNPKVIIKEKIVIDHDTIKVPTEVIKYSNDYYGFKWNHDTTYCEGNFQILNGETKFKLDKNGFSDINTLITKNSMGLTLKTGINKVDGIYKIFVESEHPDFKIIKIDGAILDKDMVLSDESSWVVGPNLGYGLQVQSNGVLSHGVTIGMGVTYNFNKNIKKIFKR